MSTASCWSAVSYSSFIFCLKVGGWGSFATNWSGRITSTLNSAYSSRQSLSCEAWSLNSHQTADLGIRVSSVCNCGLRGFATLANECIWGSPLLRSVTHYLSSEINHHVTLVWCWRLGCCRRGKIEFLSVCRFERCSRWHSKPLIWNAMLMIGA